MYGKNFYFLVLFGLIFQRQVQAKICLDKDNLSKYSNAVVGSSLSSCGGTKITKLPFVVQQPGLYLIDCDLDAPSCQAAITISVDDVTIDFGCFAISGGMHGILIEQDLNNITIKNGSINDAEANGVCVKAGCSCIRLQNLTLINCNHTECEGKGGIFFEGLESKRICNCIIKGVNVSNSEGVGFLLQWCDVTKVSDSCASCISCHKSPANAVGFFTSGSFNCFDNCKALQILASDLSDCSAFGFYASQSNGSRFTRCEALFNRAFMPALGVTGFFISASECTLVQDCVSCDNSADSLGNGGVGAQHARGFFSSNSVTTLFMNCVACGNKAKSSGTGQGFLVDSNTNSALLNCAALDNGDEGFSILNDAGTILGKNRALGHQIGFRAEAAPPLTPPLASILFSNSSLRNTTNYTSGVFFKDSFNQSNLAGMNMEY